MRPRANKESGLCDARCRAATAPVSARVQGSAAGGAKCEGRGAKLAPRLHAALPETNAVAHARRLPPEEGRLGARPYCPAPPSPLTASSVQSERTGGARAENHSVEGALWTTPGGSGGTTEGAEPLRREEERGAAGTDRRTPVEVRHHRHVRHLQTRRARPTPAAHEAAGLCAAAAEDRAQPRDEEGLAPGAAEALGRGGAARPVCGGRGVAVSRTRRGRGVGREGAGVGQGWGSHAIRYGVEQSKRSVRASSRGMSPAGRKGMKTPAARGGGQARRVCVCGGGVLASRKREGLSQRVR